jgi:hypothetical protein
MKTMKTFIKNIFQLQMIQLKESLTFTYNNVKTAESGKPSPKFDYENQKAEKRL